MRNSKFQNANPPHQGLSDSEEEEEEEKEVEEKIVEPPPPQAPLLHSDSEDEEVNLYQYSFIFISSHPFVVLTLNHGCLFLPLCFRLYQQHRRRRQWEKGEEGGE